MSRARLLDRGGCAVAAVLLAGATLALAGGRSKGNPQAGRKLYNDKCIVCHKPDGSGGVKLTGNPTPDWRDSARMADPTHDDAALRDCILNGRPASGMPVWPKQGLKRGQVEDLIAYIRTFSAPPKPKK